MVERLPVSSAYVEAQANDPDYAAWVATQPSGPPAPPRLADWSTEVDLLARVVDRIGELTSVVAGALGGKPRPPQPVTRPVTEVDRARERAADQRHHLLVAEVKAAQRRYQQARGVA